MDLNLSDAEVALLADLLPSTLGDLRMEISATDNYEYRQGLREREETLRSLMAKLGLS